MSITTTNHSDSVTSALGMSTVKLCRYPLLHYHIITPPPPQLPILHLLHSVLQESAYLPTYCVQVAVHAQSSLPTISNILCISAAVGTHTGTVYLGK